MPNKRVLRDCLWTGAIGVASGFAVFLLTIEDQSPLQFMLILAAATGLSLFIEHLRDEIDTTPAEAREHRDASARIFVSLLIVGLAELFALGWHAGITLWGTPELHAALQIVRGNALPTDDFGLFLLVGVWVVSGMAVAGAIARGIGSSARPVARRVGAGAGRGMAVGVVAAPVVLFLTIVVGFALKGFGLVLFDPKVWVENFHVAQTAAARLTGMPGAVVNVILIVADKLLSLLGEQNPWAPTIVVMAMIVGGVVSIRKHLGWLGPALLTMAAGLVMAPFLPGFGQTMLLLVRTAVVWAIPGAVLGALVPLLERPAILHRWWSVIAFAAALVLIVLTAARLEGRWWLFVPAAGIIATGAFVWRTGRVDACWPVLAISIATIVCGLVITLQQFATFTGILRSLYDIESLPPRIASEFPAARTVVEFDLATHRLAEGVASTKSDAAKLDDYDHQAEALVNSGRALRDGLEQLKAKPAECFSDGTEKTPKPFGKRLRDVACGESLLAMLDPVPNQLQGSRALTLKVDAIHRAHEQDGAGVLRDRSQALLDKLNSNEQMLEALLNDPLNGRNVTDLLGGRSLDDFKLEADDAYLTVCRYLELALAGSFGFWVTLGLLAGWSRYRSDAGGAVTHA